MAVGDDREKWGLGGQRELAAVIHLSRCSSNVHSLDAMAYRTKLTQASPTRSARPSSLSWEPSTELFSSFPGASSSSPSAAGESAPSSAVSASSVPFASLADLPDELLLSISSLVYLPPTEYASAYARNDDLKSLGLAGGPRVQDVVRAVLFEQTTCTTDKEVRWLATDRKSVV